jgi:uncharacterized protein (TIGR03437 family)
MRFNAVTFRSASRKVTRTSRSLTTLMLLIWPAGLFGQTVPVIIGGGYRNPDAFQVAGGQVITIFLRAAQTLLPLYSPVGIAYRFVIADSVPLPTSLAGFSARVQEAVIVGSFGDLAPAPIFAVQQLPICLDTTANTLAEPPATAECWVTAITLQIPFSVQPPHPFQITQTRYRLIVSEGKTDSTSVLLSVEQASIHFVTGCDRIGLSNGYNTAGLQGIGFCGAIATHLDGSFIGPDAPAKPSEIVVLYAYGLGLTSPDPPPAGSLTPAPAPQLNTPLSIQFDFRPLATPSIPQVDPKDTSPSPILFAGLAPGQVGLYQINVKLPDVFPVVARCNLSNLTINISGTKSFDGAQICVAPAQ